jgi:hypothetical protein
MKVADLFVDLKLDTSVFERDLKSALGKAERVATLKVSAVVDDTALKKFQTQVTSLKGNTVKVDADTSSAESAVKTLEKKIGDAGEDAGASFSKGLDGAIAPEMPKIGKGMGSGLLDGLSDTLGKTAGKAGVAGLVVGAVGIAGLAAGKIFMTQLEKGMAVNRAKFNFGAATGLGTKQVEKYAFAAGNAYANVFGESVAANLDTAKAALQGGLLNRRSTQRDVQAVIEQLTQVSETLGVDIPEASRAAGQMLRTGLAKNAEQAFDIIVKGNQLGINSADDLLDTFSEYGTQFRKLGLDGEKALTLISQLVKGGARDTDVAADAIKEFSIRTQEAFGEMDAKGRFTFNELGGAIIGALDLKGTDEQLILKIENVQNVLARGGAPAQEMFAKITKGFGDIKQGVDKNKAGVALFGTQFEDLGGAIDRLDPSKVLRVAGATDKLVSAVGQDPAQAMEAARRSIEVSADQIRGSLATAFAPLIKDFGTWVTTHRADILDFFAKMTVGAFDVAIAVSKVSAPILDVTASVVELGAKANETFADIVDGALDAGRAVADLDPSGLARKAFDSLTDGTQDVADRMRSQASVQEKYASGLRKTAEGARSLANGLQKAKEKFEESTEAAKKQARLSDAQAVYNQKMSAFADVAEKAAGKVGSLREATRLFNNRTTEQGRALADVKQKFREQFAAAQSLGAKQGELNVLHRQFRSELRSVFTQMGLTRAEAAKLVNKYDEVPGSIKTKAEFDDTKAKNDTRTYKEYVNQQLAGIEDEPVKITLSAAAARLSRGANLGASLGVTNRARGGRIIGPGSGTSDSIPAMLSNGEHVLTAKEVAAMGGQRNVELWRKAALKGALPDPSDLPRFAGGGEVRTIPKTSGSVNVSPIERLVTGIAARLSRLVSAAAERMMSTGGGRPLGPGGSLSNGQIIKGQQFARAQNGKPYIWGGVGPAGYDCSGYQSAILNASMGRNPYSRVGTTASSPWAGSQGGVGRYTIGYFKGSPGHMSGNIGGLGVESTGDHVRVGSGARSPMSSMFSGRFHYAQGGPVDTVPAWLQPGEFVIKRSAAQAIGRSRLSAMNAGKYAAGGAVGRRGRLAAGTEATLRDIANGLASGFDASEVAKDLRQVVRRNLSGQAEKNTLKRLDRLNRISDRIAAATSRVASARTALENARGAKTTFTEGIRGQLGADISEFGSTSGGIKAGLSGKLAAVKDFVANLKRLGKNKFVPRALLAQIAQLGPLEGNAAAKQLLGLSVADLRAVSGDFTALNAFAAAQSDLLGDTYYDAGIKSAKAHLKEMQAQQAALNKIFEKTADAFATRLARNLHVDLTPGRRGRATHDNGGWLQTGRTLAVNNTGRPEAVLTAQQWGQMERLISAVERGGGHGAPFIGSAVIRETVDLDRYERQRAFRERRTRV